MYFGKVKLYDYTFYQLLMWFWLINEMFEPCFQCASTSIWWEMFVSARIRAGSRFKRFLCFVLIDVRCLRLPQVADHWSKAWTVLSRSNAGVVGSKPTRGIDICACVYPICISLRVGSGLTMSWSSVQEVLQTVYRIKKLGKRPEIHGLNGSKRGFCEHRFIKTAKNFNINQWLKL
jgi:hypothetical protein